jgi:hypothetical protein
MWSTVRGSHAQVLQRRASSLPPDTRAAVLRRVAQTFQVLLDLAPLLGADEHAGCAMHFCNRKPRTTFDFASGARPAASSSNPPTLRMLLARALGAQGGKFNAESLGAYGDSQKGLRTNFRRAQSGHEGGRLPSGGDFQTPRPTREPASSPSTSRSADEANRFQEAVLLATALPACYLEPSSARSVRRVTERLWQ